MAKQSSTGKAEGAKASRRHVAKKATGAQRPRSPRNPWSQEPTHFLSSLSNLAQEDDRLRNLVAAFGWTPGQKNFSWLSIAEAMGTRSHKQCRERWNNSLQPGLSRMGSWSEDEDKLIMLLQEQLGNKWAAIAGSLEGRTDSAVKNRYYSLKRSADKAGGEVKKSKEGSVVAKTVAAAANETVQVMTSIPTLCGAAAPMQTNPSSTMSMQEDARLKRLVSAASGAGDGVSWPSIAAAIGNRSHKQCRDRWVNNLQPGVKVGDWAANEDKLILLLQKQWGNTWEEIAASLPGRTGSAVKNRCNSLWRTAERQKRAVEMEEESTVFAAKKTPKTNAAKTPKARVANCPVAAAINFVESTGVPAEAPMKTIYPMPAKRPDPAHLEAAFALKDFAISPVPVRPVGQLARSMFSPTHTDRVMEGLASPTPTLPLAATADCMSGPFFSPIKGKRTPQTEEASFTPLPYRRKRLSFTAALVDSPSPLKCAV
ncbi:hypothetical protein ACHAXT_002849 [Thalassiosira profunda]